VDHAILIRGYLGHVRKKIEKHWVEGCCWSLKLDVATQWRVISIVRLATRHRKCKVCRKRTMAFTDNQKGNQPRRWWASSFCNVFIDHAFCSQRIFSFRQDIFECLTCGLTETLCCCTECARVCHKGHDCKWASDCPRDAKSLESVDVCDAMIAAATVSSTCCCFLLWRITKEIDLLQYYYQRDVSMSSIPALPKRRLMFSS